MIEQRAYLRDCMDAMAEFPDKFFDLAVVDPPYGTMDMWQTGGSNKSGTREKMSKWDSRPQKNYFLELSRVSKNQIIWGGNYFIDHLKPTRCVLIWDKITRNMWADGEMAWTSFNENMKIFRYAKADAVINDKENLPRIHPTQKPVKLYDWIFANYAKPGQKILDTHLGSGSSRIAANKAGLDFWGYELDADYFAAHEKRYANFIAQLRLF